jgi:hypothetical protein
LAYNLITISIIFPNFLHSILDMVWTTTYFNYKYPLMRMHTSHQPYGYHLLQCAQNNECTKTHDVICDTFLAIAHDVGFHMG